MARPRQTLYQVLGVPDDANAIDIGLANERKREARWGSPRRRIRTAPA